MDWEEEKEELRRALVIKLGNAAHDEERGNGNTEEAVWLEDALKIVNKLFIFGM